MADVDYRSPEYIEAAAAREPCELLVDGLEAIREDAGANSQYFWPGPGEMDRRDLGGTRSISIFEDRKRRLRLRNIWASSLRQAAAVPYRQPLELQGWPPAVMSRTENIDGAGGTVDSLAAEATRNKLFRGIHFIRADLPGGGGDPYWAPVVASDFTFYAWAMESGRVFLTQANVEVGGQRAGPQEDPNNFDPPDGEARRKIVYTSPRADDPVSFQTYTLAGSQWLPDDPPALLGNGTLKEIPIAPFYAERIAPYRSPPLFRDQALDQMDLLRRNSELRELTRRAAAPLEIFTGADPASEASNYTDLGDQIFLHNPAAKATMLEIHPALIDSLEAGIERDEAALRRACLAPLLADTARNVTATEIGIASMEAMSWLDASMATDLRAVERLLEWTSVLMGFVPPESASVKSGAPISQIAEEIQGAGVAPQ